MAWGYDASVLKDTIIPIEKQKIVTEENTIERQMQLMKAMTAGKKFSVMGGNHLTADDIFIATEMTLREKEKQRLEVLKKKCERLSSIEAQAKLVIENKGTDATSWSKTDLDAVLGWYGVKKLSSMGKGEKVEKWNQTKHLTPTPIEHWTDDLEQQLLAASSTNIAIGDTAVGRYEHKKMEDFKRAAPKFSADQWAIMNAVREQHETNQGLGGDP
jgi:hypothetical protein